MCRHRYFPAIVVIAAIGNLVPLHAQISPWSDSLVGKIRSAATMIPGAPPQTVHVLRFASLDVLQSSFLQNGSEEHIPGAYSVFQIRFADGWIMVDAGVDAEIARSNVTIHKDKYDQVQLALQGARSIVVTHEHDDHVAVSSGLRHGS